MVIICNNNEIIIMKIILMKMYIINNINENSNVYDKCQ